MELCKKWIKQKKARNYC